jgi:hypothetical protein
MTGHVPHRKGSERHGKSPPAAADPRVTSGDANMNGMTDEERDIKDEAVPAEESAGNPLHKKLGIRPGLTGAIVAPPEENGLLAPLPEGFTVLASADDLTASEGLFDYVQFFARNRADLVKDFQRLRDKVVPGGSLWISWIKQSSVRGGGGLPGDLNENTIRRLALAGGLVDVKVAALDAEWSALKLVWRRH